MKRLVLTLAAFVLMSGATLAQSFEPLEALTIDQKLVESLNGGSPVFRLTYYQQQLLQEYFAWLSDENGNLDPTWLKSRKITQITNEYTKITNTITLVGSQQTFTMEMN